MADSERLAPIDDDTPRESAETRAQRIARLMSLIDDDANIDDW
jgi:hypothetical protein